MKRAEVQKLKHGLYRVWWKSGGNSLAAVGSFANGARWIMPTNWISFGNGNHRHIWEKIKRVTLLKKRRK